MSNVAAENNGVAIQNGLNTRRVPQYLDSAAVSALAHGLLMTLHFIDQ
ncbi:hypothetical protein FOC84_02295 [Achromobacter pestifer]|uniref:Uncharacterized protein n=1 Tax=Achromobacter pestifer TaxID=1353889 RepID=A0A7D4HQY1_9BURK|nr:hypothetical protein [Achromobacter pestifer]QKH33833.1 hypothetical protein FOC84_02295 [Achromobacter pestifer]